MALPTAYTEPELSAFMHAVLGDVATALGWSTDDERFDEAVNDTLLAYGVDDIDDATDIPKLRALARIEAWRAATDSLASRFDLSADGQSASRSQMVEHARGRYRDAVRRASSYDPAYRVVRHPLRYTNDPIALVSSEDDGT